MLAQAHSDARMYHIIADRHLGMFRNLRAQERLVDCVRLLMEIGYLSLGTCAKMRAVQRVFASQHWCMEMAFRAARRAWAPDPLQRRLQRWRRLQNKQRPKTAEVRKAAEEGADWRLEFGGR